MDYTFAPNHVIDQTGRRQLANRDLANNVPGTGAVCDDLQGVINSLMDLILHGGSLQGDPRDDTLVTQAVRSMVHGVAGYLVTAMEWSVISAVGDTPILCPDWASRVEARIIGGGGGGGTANAQTPGSGLSFSSSGGGAGADVWGTYPIKDRSLPVIVTIGAGGATQEAGGDTKLTYGDTTLATAHGGQFGQFLASNSSPGGAGGSGLGGTKWNLTGGSGGDGQDGDYVFSGYGADGPWGGGGRAGAGTGNDTGGGVDGSKPGAGGGGGYGLSLNSTVTRGGGGYPGIALYRWLP